ncbi:MAG: carboxypeptidase M32 [Thermoguttaceae bacterium]
MSAKLFDEVCRYARQTAVWASIDATLGWDERTHLPPAGAEYRAEQSALVAGLAHQRWTDPTFGRQLEELAASPLAADPESDAALIARRLRRQYDRRIKMPKTLVERLARLTILGQQAWQDARQNDDFPAFRPILEEVVELKRQQAEAIGYDDCPYDALLDEYEPEERTARVAGVLGQLRDALTPLVAEIQQSGRRPNVGLLHRDFPVALQAQFGLAAASAIGFDFARGRLDETAHPFCTTLGPHDCRITTAYDERHFGSALFSILHEAGHGLYEQGLPVEWFGLPPGEAVSLGLHESQSRLWENFVGRGRPFLTFYFPLAQQRFSALRDVSFEEFYFAINDVRPSLIRIEADEATYNLHILIRFELERALLDGQLQAADLPAAWNEKYQTYLGVTPPNDRDGVLQDVHWSAGLIGYFPTYALGNLYAAQFFAQARRDIGDLDARLTAGDFRPLLDWLRDRIHRHGQRWSAAELVRRATGRELSIEPLMEHLRTKLAPLYLS